MPGIFTLRLQSLTAGPISSAASPNPGRIPFDQARNSAEHGFHPLAPTVLKLVVRSHSATTRGNEGSFVDWHLISLRSVQWSPQISPGPGSVRVCVCVHVVPCCSSASDSWQNGQDFLVKHQSHEMKSVWRVFILFFFCSICLQMAGLIVICCCWISWIQLTVDLWSVYFLKQG